MKQPILTQKTTSHTIHGDGTKISTTIILETIPDSLNSEKTETTTIVKEYVVEKDADKDEIIQVEEITETTVTKKRMYNKCKHESIEMGWGRMLCGDKPIREEVGDHEDDLAMDTVFNLDTFGSKTVSSNELKPVHSNTVQGNKSVNKNTDNDSRNAPSALSMFTSPSAFFRKTHPSRNEEAPPKVEQEEISPPAEDIAVERDTSEQMKLKKKPINLDEEILNIVKKHNGKETNKNASTKTTAIPPYQQTEQSHNQKQSRQASSSKCIDNEERQDNIESCTTSINSLATAQRRSSNRVRTPSPNPKVASMRSSRPSSRNSQMPNNALSSSQKMAKTTSNRSSSKKRKKDVLKPIVPKYKQSLLSTDSDFASPKLTLSTTTAAVTDDKFVHFFSYQPASINQSQRHESRSSSLKWRKSTTVAIENTYCMNVAIHNNTAVVGVPYDRNNKGLLTGAAYIFEREENKDIWTQVKKIVPKQATEFATVGYSVGIHDDIIVVSVPNVGSTHPAGGSVHLYRRVQKYKWSDKGALIPPVTEEWANAGVAGAKRDVKITAVNKMKKGVSNKKKFGTRVAIQGNVVVVSDHYDHDETSIYVYEYDDFSLKWVCVQDDILSKAQQRHFGSRLALLNNGNGILVGCHAKMCPTEILYYSRYGTHGKYHLQQVIVVSKRSSSYGVGRGVVGKNGVTEDITDFKVDGKNLIVGTTSSVGQQNQHCVYVYQLQENDTWMLMSKVDDPSLPGFGQCVGLAGNRAMIATRCNAFSYNIESLVPKDKRKQFLAIANITEEKRRIQSRSQVKYIDPEYLQLPYTGSNLNNFRSRQQVALQSQVFYRSQNDHIHSTDTNGSDKSSNNSTSCSPTRMSLNVARKTSTKKTIMSRMRSPSPMLRRITGTPSKKRNISAPPLRSGGMAYR